MIRGGRREARGSKKKRKGRKRVVEIRKIEGKEEGEIKGRGGRKNERSGRK